MNNFNIISDAELKLIKGGVEILSETLGHDWVPTKPKMEQDNGEGTILSETLGHDWVPTKP